nr:ferrochelatase [Nitrosophilus kaiyonis]
MKALVLLNMGGPNDLEEVELFLKNMFNDPNIMPIKNSLLRRFVAYMITSSRKKEAKSNYEKLGGKSPLNFYTKKLIEKLKNYLPDFYITYAMRYTPPFSKDVIKELMSKNIKEVYLFPLYPHYSKTTVKSSLEDFYNSAKGYGFHARIHDISNFYENRKYNEAVIEKILETLENKDSKEFDLIFSAHSLPKKIIESGDNYQFEIEDNVKILKEILKEKGINFNAIYLAYQSKLGPVKWLEPSLDEVLKDLKNKKVIIYPISFILDNSETLFELHIEYFELAKKIGIKEYKVCECLNDSEKFCEAVREIVKEMG